MEKSIITRINKLFFIFIMGAFAGWVWEVLLFFVITKEFTNRGFLHGPWLPVYGFGMLLVCLVRKITKYKIIPFFFLNAFLFAIVEYAGSWMLEKVFNKKWWDYSYEAMNLNGRICLKYVILFALAGCIAGFILVPFILKLFNKYTKQVMVLNFILACIIIVDVIYSFAFPNVGNNITESAFFIIIK